MWEGYGVSPAYSIPVRTVINLRQLSYFLQIAELQSFTRAASVLHVAQPSLSRQIQMLEHELGVLLFVRSDKGVTLTEAGRVLQERAATLLQQVRQIRDEIGLKSSEPRGQLSFGLPPSFLDLLSVPLVCAFRARHPKVELRLTEGVSALLHEQVVVGKLDAAVVSDAEPLGLLRSRPLLREPLHLVGPSDAALDAAQELPVASLVERPLLLTSRPNAMRLIVERALGDIGQRIVPVVEANSSRLLCELVARGEGYTVLPFSAFFDGFRSGRLRAAPLAGLSVTWTLVTSRDRGLSLAGHKLRELLAEVARSQIATGVWRGAVDLY